MFTKETFQSWMNDYFQNKFNQLSYSNQRLPKRMEKITLDLSVASVNPLKIPVPFKSCLVSRVYSTATPTTDKAGSVKILFDYENTMNVQNAISIFVNDAFSMDNSVSQAFLTWSAQADTSIDLYFFVDIDYRAGTTKTQIVGTVSTQNSSATAFYNKPPIPDSCTAYTLTGTASNTTIYTCPVGKYAIVSATSSGAVGGDNAQAKIGGTIYHYGWGAAPISSKITMIAGQVLTASSSQASSSQIAFLVEEYSK